MEFGGVIYSRGRDKAARFILIVINNWFR